MVRRRHDDRGDTLLELIITIAILGVCVVAIASTIAISIRVSSIHRTEADLGTALHNYAEQVDAMPYVACGPYSLPTQPGFSAPTVSVAFWNGTSFAACPGTDAGVQRVTITLISSDGQASDSLSVVVRNPS